MSDEVAVRDPLGEWFRRIGTQLSDEDYEAGIRAIASRDALVESQAVMTRKPRRIACPVCKQEAEGQLIYTEGIRTFQHFICDTAKCPVGSFRIEWRDGAK